ncbi:wax ester/triacylglycerol synthase domain-containing protein [Ornithinimicrobium sp. LYQ121]|uniref:wax ester/triacylglycerol synthase domain-containing protein n=1 Tax=Ornithinimicrobium sp. LYQ121 TaxID=3378801 RepID=UPI0038519AB8
MRPSLLPWRREGGERLSAADASNVEIDAGDQVNVFLMAGLLGPGGWVATDGCPDLDLLRRVVGERLAQVTSGELRRFSQRVGTSGRHLVWEPCRPDLGWHVRSVEPVDGGAGLADLCSLLMTVPLSLDRPLWELLVVPGASPEGPGLVLRIHHAVADGVAGVALLRAFFGDGGPGPSERSTPAVAETTPPTTRPGRLSSLLTSLTRVVAVFRATVPPTVLLGPLGAHRGVAFVEVDLAPLARAARTAGGTVNDALLAAVTAAAEAALRVDGHPVPAVLPASVPVALPDRRGSGNAVGVMLVGLPTGEPDVRRRLASVAATTSAAKAGARSQGTLELTRTRWGSRLFARLARRQRFIALFVTNVRGPREPLSLGGAPLRRAWPVVPLQGNVRFGVSALSYAGRLACTVHVDADVLRADVAARTLQDELGGVASPSPPGPDHRGQTVRPIRPPS